MSTYLAECIEYRIEVYQYLPLGDLGNVVETLRREVPYPVLRVREAHQ